MLTGFPRIISSYPIGVEVTPRRGDSFELNCTAEGDPSPTISWTYNGQPIANSIARAVATEGRNGVL